MCIFLGIECFDIPRKLHEELQQIYAGDAAVYERELLSCRAVAREEAVFNRVQEYVVNLAAKREAVCLGEVGKVLLPKAVGVLKLQYDRDKSRLRDCRGGGDVQGNASSFQPSVRILHSYR